MIDSKFKIGDKVKIIRGHHADGELWSEKGFSFGVIVAESPKYGNYDWEVKIEGPSLYFSENELVLITEKENENG